MHYVTLDHIDEYIAKKNQTKSLSSFLLRAAKEVGMFAGVFAAVFLLTTVFVNAGLFYHTLTGLFTPVRAEHMGVDVTMLDASFFGQNPSSPSTLDNSALPLFSGSTDQPHTTQLGDYLQQQAMDYHFSFNTLPPDNRIIIPSINVDAPIVDISAATEEKLKNGDFDQDLYSGVVKYPSTPDPGMSGNTLIFGHTSYYRWKKNPYGEVFSKMYALETGDTIKVIRNGQVFEYTVISKVVVNPKDVDTAYMQYTDGSYLTLMGCYPIGTDVRRMLITAKRKTVAVSDLLFSHQ